MSKILVVEDNDLNMRLFNDLLSIKKHEIITSTDGIDVKNIASKERPDLILMDIQLGDISGIDLIKELKSNSSTNQIPIIAVTAFAMKNDEELIRQSGCDMYLAKPVAIDDFYEALDHYLN